MGKVVNGYTVLVRKPKRGDSSLEDNIKTDLKEGSCKGMDWIQLAHDRVQWQAVGSTAVNFRDP
jgi:hypothetical protein